jgi:hypothetical protein
MPRCGPPAVGPVGARDAMISDWNGATPFSTTANALFFGASAGFFAGRAEPELARQRVSGGHTYHTSPVQRKHSDG